ncbi:MAG TPA: AAA family ATPase, partial [Nannocystis sp.]
ESALATLTADEGGERATHYQAVQRAIADLGAGVDLLADGSVIATVFPSASAVDQALVGARCGLVMRELLPDHAVAVTTGRGVLRGEAPIGAAIDRALHLLAERTTLAVQGVWLDGLTRDLLAGRLRIAEHDGHPLLLPEQDATANDGVRRLLGKLTPCVGREHELASLAALLDACIDEPAARAVGVVAPPGMGKSRVRHELVRAALRRHPDLLVVLGRCDLMQAGAPYGPLADALRRLCGLCGDEPPATARASLRARTGLHLPAEAAGRVATFLGELCRIPAADDPSPALHAARNDPKMMRDQVLRAFVDLLRGELQHAPMLLILEDLHWGDVLSVGLVEQALRELGELPLCVLVLARPEAQELFPTFWTELHVLPLRPLARRACERLALEILRPALGDDLDPEAVARIVEQAAGHPLYLEELVRAVAEGRHDTLPETVLAMLVARLSQLDPGARQVLRAASVFGESFTQSDLAALLGDVSGLDASLAVLVRGEFVQSAREGWDGAERHKFRHALLRDAAYSLLTAEDRRAAHRLACAHLEAMGAEPAALAEHAHAAEDRALAARYHVEAAGAALASFDLDAARLQCERALACGLDGAPLGTVRAIQAWVAYFHLDQQTGYEHALAAVDALPPGSLWWTRALQVCFYSFFMLGRVEHVERLIAAFVAAEPELDARAVYVESGAVLMTFFGTCGLRRAG